jgi:hypothetical protein
LTPERAYIFRITHIDNVPWLLQHGVHCRSSPVVDPNYRNIGNLDLIDRRRQRVVTVPPGGTLSDYVPFYFTPWSPMLYNIRTGRGVPQVPMRDIVILISSLHKLAKLGQPFLFTDRHAYLEAADFWSDLKALSRLDWRRWQARDFRRDPDDPGKMERYQAEALVHRHLAVEAIGAIVCYDAAREAQMVDLIGRSGHGLRVGVRPDYYF